ncbi:MAG: hypothetical protein LBV01_02105, partial [Deltaproteobacteria bacterium]|nr:hypothetical protein [Deltaproteobacteria bacterium]
MNNEQTLPRRLLRTACALVVLLVCLLALASCAKEPEVMLSGGKVYTQSYAWYTADFDEAWLLDGLSLGFETLPLPLRYIFPTSLNKHPVPTTYKITWFHFEEQRYYEARLEDPSLAVKAKAI